MACPIQSRHLSHQVLPEGTEPGSGYPCSVWQGGDQPLLHFGDLEVLAPDHLSRVCEWLTEKVDSLCAQLKPDSKEVRGGRLGQGTRACTRRKASNPHGVKTPADLQSVCQSRSLLCSDKPLCCFPLLCIACPYALSHLHTSTPILSSSRRMRLAATTWATSTSGPFPLTGAHCWSTGGGWSTCSSVCSETMVTPAGARWRQGQGVDSSNGKSRGQEQRGGGRGEGQGQGQEQGGGGSRGEGKGVDPGTGI